MYESFVPGLYTGGQEVTHQGCFLDEVSSRDLKVFIDLGENNTYAACIDHCLDRKYRYAAVQVLIMLLTNIYNCLRQLSCFEICKPNYLCIHHVKNRQIEKCHSCVMCWLKCIYAFMHQLERERERERGGGGEWVSYKSLHAMFASIHNVGPAPLRSFKVARLGCHGYAFRVWLHGCQILRWHGMPSESITSGLDGTVRILLSSNTPSAWLYIQNAPIPSDRPGVMLWITMTDTLCYGNKSRHPFVKLRCPLARGKLLG